MSEGIEKSTTIPRVVIIGGGQAGAQTAIALRQNGFDGEVQIVGEEGWLPYQRPPLSKGFLKGDFPQKRLYFKSSDWYAKHQIEIRLATRALRLDLKNKVVHLNSGDPLHYDWLVLATGSQPRKLSIEGAELPGVFDLRGIRDVEKIQPQLIEGQSAVFIGAGYIGLEAAATARQLGLDVTVLEYADRVLARVTSPQISTFFEQLHMDHGVKIITGARVNGIKSAGDDLRVLTEDGGSFEANIVFTGIGVEPRCELAKEAGIECENGILTNRDARTSDPAVFAVGDCSYRPLVHYDRYARLESVHNAVEQGKLAAAAISGQDRPREDCPWFWSDQFDVKLQIAGLSQGFDTTITRGSLEEKKFAIYYFNGDQLLAVDAVNSPPDFMMAKKLILARVPVKSDLLADETRDIKDIAKELLAKT